MDSAACSFIDFQKKSSQCIIILKVYCHDEGLKLPPRCIMEGVFRDRAASPRVK